ncbi:MAG: sulfotransferase family 2 domain-containing protein [Desulforegulaceae bacterium]|nr:sulfotransferase family 2 domain-containing protein [Desulforegulaceae bacterium]
MFRKILLKTKSIYRQSLFPYSPISLKKKVLFIHIPKAAGTAVRVALGEPETGRLHLPWWVYHQASPQRFNNFYKFAFVRDPLDRVFSGYRYLKSGGNKMGDLEIAKYLEKYKSFNEFLECEFLNGKMIYHPIFRPQSWYLCNWKGEIQVNFIGRFETMADDFDIIADKIGLEDFKELTVINKTLSKPEVFSIEAKEIIYNTYQDDYQIFDYSIQ